MSRRWPRCWNLPRHGLNLDALRLLHGRGTRDPHLEHAAVEAGMDAVLVHALRQRHAPAERTVAPLPHVVAGPLALLLGLALAGDGQHPVVDRDVNVLELDPGKLGPDDDVPVLVQHVERRSPPRGLVYLPAPTASGQAAKRLVEHPVHLALHVVETTERTQSHLAYLLTRPATPRREAVPSDCATIIPL
jgi:hypothetical protein